MTKLTDKQQLILSHAASRDDRCILPFPSFLTLNKASLTTVLKSLEGKNLLAERNVPRGGEYWREAEDGKRFSYFITDAGLEAIGVDPAEFEASPPAPPAESEASVSPSKAPRGHSKLGILVSLLKREKGATVAEMMEASGWQAHSIRGAISGAIKKKLQLPIETQVDETRGRIYHIREAA